MKSLRICLLTLLLGLGLSFSSPVFSEESAANTKSDATRPANPDDATLQADNARLELPPDKMAATVNAPGVDCPECRKNMSAGAHSAGPKIEPESAATDGNKPPIKGQPQKK